MARHECSYEAAVRGRQAVLRMWGVSSALGKAYALPILNTVRSQTVHLPRVAGLPFLSVTP